MAIENAKQQRSERLEHTTTVIRYCRSKYTRLDSNGALAAFHVKRGGASKRTGAPVDWLSGAEQNALTPRHTRLFDSPTARGDYTEDHESAVTIEGVGTFRGSTRFT